MNTQLMNSEAIRSAAAIGALQMNWPIHRLNALYYEGTLEYPFPPAELKPALHSGVPEIFNSLLGRDDVRSALSQVSFQKFIMPFRRMAGAGEKGRVNSAKWLLLLLGLYGSHQVDFIGLSIDYGDFEALLMKALGKIELADVVSGKAHAVLEDSNLMVKNEDSSIIYFTIPFVYGETDRVIELIMPEFQAGLGFGIAASSPDSFNRAAFEKAWQAAAETTDFMRRQSFIENALPASIPSEPLVHAIDFRTGLIGAGDLTDTAFWQRYFDGLITHQVVVFNIPRTLGFKERTLLNGYVKLTTRPFAYSDASRVLLAAERFDRLTENVTAFKVDIREFLADRSYASRLEIIRANGLAIGRSALLGLLTEKETAALEAFTTDGRNYLRYNRASITELLELVAERVKHAKELARAA